MSTVSLRSSVWTATAGLIPGQPMPEYTRSWFYTELDYEKEGCKRGPLFLEQTNAAHDYAQEAEKGGFNWVKVEHIWL